LLKQIAVAAGLGAALVAHAADEEKAPPGDPPRKAFEGALGPVIGRSAEYPGAARDNTSLGAGFYLRYDRISLSNTGAFVNRRNDAVARGLAADVLRREHLRLNVSLRIDSGRRSSVSDALRGLPDVRRTVRARFSATWRPDAQWLASATWSPDILGRGGGYFVGFGVGREHPLPNDATWSWGAGATYAGKHLLRSQFGVPADTTTAYAPYAPGEGWRDVNASLGWRREFARRWVAFASASAARLVGPAARSPIVFDRNELAFTAGVARRF
jgi:outer membrane scaffolding protein for murein synthesis (MipA/OmpV family)